MPGSTDDLPLGVPQSQDLAVVEMHVDGIRGDGPVEVLGLDRYTVHTDGVTWSKKATARAELPAMRFRKRELSPRHAPRRAGTGARLHRVAYFTTGPGVNGGAPGR